MQRSVLELGKTIKFIKIGGKVRGIFRVGQNVSAFECEMSVAYTYYKILKERQRQYQKRSPYLLPYKKDAAPAPPPRAGGKAEPPGTTNSSRSLDEAEENELQHQHKFHMPKLKNIKGNCQELCAITFHVLVGVLTILVSIGVIIVTSLVSVAAKAYDSEQSSRLVAMVVLAVTAALALSMAIYAIIGAFRKHAKSVHATGVVFIILVIIQALIIVLAIKISVKDELNIGASLTDSFRLAKEDNPRHVKLWAATQNDLHCCGVYSADDYRDPTMPYYFPPNVPISCCPTYNPKSPPYTQERNRETCKSNGAYYTTGCKALIVEVFKESSVVVTGITFVLIVLEIFLTLLGAYINKKHKETEKKQSDDENPEYSKK